MTKRRPVKSLVDSTRAAMASCRGKNSRRLTTHDTPTARSPIRRHLQPMLSRFVLMVVVTEIVLHKSSFCEATDGDGKIGKSEFRGRRRASNGWTKQERIHRS